jgi:fructokinase
MQKAELVKVNDDELALMCKHLGISASGLQEQLFAVLDSCRASSICVTRGAEGAALIHQNEFYSHPGYSSQVVDTVGAGDAFLAGLISELVNTNLPEAALSVACAIGSQVSAQAGAQSPISLEY